MTVHQSRLDAAEQRANHAEHRLRILLRDFDRWVAGLIAACLVLALVAVVGWAVALS